MVTNLKSELFLGLSYISLDTNSNTSFFISIYRVRTIAFMIYIVLFIGSIKHSVQKYTTLQNKVLLYTMIIRPINATQFFHLVFPLEFRLVKSLPRFICSTIVAQVATFLNVLP